MPFHPFPVPARAHGTSHRYDVANTNQSMLVSRLSRTEWTGQEFAVPVTLLEDPRGGGFKVKWDYGVIGTLPQSLRQRYPELNRILRSSLNPEVTAWISRDREALRISVELADPGLLLPVNTWPSSPWMLMPYGEPYEIDVEISSATVKQKLADCNHRQFLVRLALMDDDSIAVLAGGEELEDDVVGVLHEPAYTQLKDAINHFEMLGLIPVARAYSWDGTATVESIRTADLTEEQLEPPISPMRQLIAESEATPGAESNARPAFGTAANSSATSVAVAGGPATVTDKGNGQWALTMPSETFPAVTPERIAEYEAALSRAQSHHSESTTAPAPTPAQIQRGDSDTGDAPQEPDAVAEPPTEAFRAVTTQKPQVDVGWGDSAERRHVEEAVKDLPETPLWPLPPLAAGPAFQRNMNRQRPRPVSASRPQPYNTPAPREPEAPAYPDSTTPPPWNPEMVEDVTEDSTASQHHSGRIITWTIVLLVLVLVIVLAILL